MIQNMFSGETYYKTLIDSFPSPVLILDQDVQVHYTNHTFKEQINDESQFYPLRFCGDLLNCTFALHSEGGCGTA